MTAEASRKLYGRIGGLTAWATLEPEVMVGPAHRGFRARFERLVDPEGQLDPVELAKRTERAMRAHLLALAAKSAEARRKRRSGGASASAALAIEAQEALAIR